MYTRLRERQPWGWVRLSDWENEIYYVVKAEWKCISIWFCDFLFFILFCEFFIFLFFSFILFVMSSESPSDGDFLESLLLVW